MSHQDIPDPSRPFAVFFRLWLSRQGYSTPAAAARVLKVSVTTAYCWANGATCVPRTRLAVFADRFGVKLATLAKVALPREKRRRRKVRTTAHNRQRAAVGAGNA